MMTLYATRRCAYCNKTGSIMVDEKELLHYLRGNFVQDSFKNMTAPFREQIITGTHPECWQEMFGREMENVND
jgi:thioredoxin-related protein